MEINELDKPARNQDKSYWIEYAEKLEAEIAGKEEVIKVLHNDIQYYRKDWKDQMIQDQGLDEVRDEKSRSTCI